MLKKTFSLVLLLITAGVFIISCSDDDSSTGPDDNGGNSGNSPICQIMEPVHNDSIAMNSAVQVKIKSKGIDSFVKETSILLNGYVVQTFPAQVDESDTLRYFYWMTPDSVATNKFIAKSEDMDGNTSLSTIISIISADINMKPVCEIISISEHNNVESDSILAVEVSASDVDGEISKVEFYVDGTLVSTDRNAPYIYHWEMFLYDASSEHSITARACDNENASSSDEASVLIVKPWQKFFGGSGIDEAHSIQQTSDGGYIIAGGNGSQNMWVLKISVTGEKEWDKVFGSGSDKAFSIQQTSDGGYIVAGTTSSYGYGSRDMWIIKLSVTGEKEWDKIFGGADWDIAKSIQQTNDGGYVVTGYTESYGNGLYDMWIIKLSVTGEKEWDKTFGGSESDYANTIQQTSDGGYIVAGYTESYGNDSHDMLIIKLSATGEKEWDKTFGGSEYDFAHSIQQTNDGGYVIAGKTRSYGSGESDMWVVKISAFGEKEWDKTFGGTGSDAAYSIQQTSDGGYVVAGYTSFYGSGESDMLIIKLSATGEKEWDKTFGGNNNDYAYSIQQTTDGGYVVAGGTESYGSGESDMWIIKFFE